MAVIRKEQDGLHRSAGPRQRSSVQEHQDSADHEKITRNFPMAETLESENDLNKMLAAVRDLSQARTLSDVMAVVRVAARELSHADGVTFVLRDEDKCYYAEENAIGPLWKGLRFPANNCISG